MENQESIYKKIIDITRKIQEQHPELIKYLSEMPNTIQNENNKSITLQNLENYYNSLSELLKSYGATHKNN